jgi:co-chaperonin GroES (HSP10)
MDDNSPPADQTPVRYIKPLGPRVLVRIVQLEDRSSAGLYLPQGARENHEEAVYGEVLEVARADDDGDTEGTIGENVSGIPLGAMVLLPKKAGTRVPWDESLRLIAVRDLLATVEEVSRDEIQ